MRSRLHLLVLAAAFLAGCGATLPTAGQAGRAAVAPARWIAHPFPGKGEQRYVKCAACVEEGADLVCPMAPRRFSCEEYGFEVVVALDDGSRKKRHARRLRKEKIHGSVRMRLEPLTTVAAGARRTAITVRK